MAGSTSMFAVLPTEVPTRYTLWSNDRLLGHTELDYARIQLKFRMGDFTPTELGEKLMPILTGVSRTTIDLSKSSREMRGEAGSSTTVSEHREVLRQTTAYADAKAAQDQYEAMALELRGPDGSVIPTESIGIQDTEFLLALAEEAIGEFDSSDVTLPDDADAARRAAIERDAAVLDEVRDELEDVESDFEAAVNEPWEELAFPRYQIHVDLVDDRSIP